MSVLRMTPEQVQRHQAKWRSQPIVSTEEKPKRSKHRNEITWRHGLRFDSLGEADRWDELLLERRAGNVKGLLRQVPFEFALNDVYIGKYVADFVYDEREGGQWNRIVEDFKGRETDMFKWKNKMMFAFHGVTVRRTKKHESRS